MHNTCTSNKISILLMSLNKLQISDQDQVRYDALDKIRELGVNPFPAVHFPVNFKTSDFTTDNFRAGLVKGLEKIKGLGPEGAKQAATTLLAKRFKVAQLLENNELPAGLAETIGFDAGVEREDMALADYVSELRVSALGDFQPSQFPEVHIAGRFMGQRGPFAKLQDSEGRIQLYLRKGEVGSDEAEIERNNQLIKLLHIGDYIGVSGELFSTQTGELTLKVRQLVFLGKSLRTLPIVKRDKAGNIYDAFTDPELRYRQRYVDLTVNPHVKEIFLKRSRIITVMRNYFDEQGWLEVETPVLQPIHGGAAARPFETHHNTLDMPLFLRIANELYLKRLIVGGFDGVYEFGKMFRNEGMDRTHNPEFTSMEIYVAYKDYIWMMKMVEQLLEKVALAVNGSTKVQLGEHEIDFAGPYHRLSMFEADRKSVV